MKKKLTLTIEDDLVKKAKLFCINNNTSISQILENIIYNLDKVAIRDEEFSYTYYDLYFSKKTEGL